MKFPRTVRLDLSDQNVFSRAALPGELAVTGSFAFADLDPEKLSAKGRQAFRNAWLGLDSFGHATLVEIAEVDERELDRAVERLAALFVSDFGAPDMPAALPVAQDEVSYTASLCTHETGVLLAIEREVAAEGIRERVYPVAPQDPLHGGIRLWGQDDE